MAFSCKALRVPSLLERPLVPPAGEEGGEMETFFSEGNFFLRDPWRINPVIPVSFLGGETGSDTVLALSHRAVRAGSCLAGSNDLLSPEDSVVVGEQGPPGSTWASTTMLLPPPAEAAATGEIFFSAGGRLDFRTEGIFTCGEEGQGSSYAGVTPSWPRRKASLYLSCDSRSFVNHVLWNEKNTSHSSLEQESLDG